MARFDKIEKLGMKSFHALKRSYEDAGHAEVTWEELRRQYFLLLVKDCFREVNFERYIDLLCEYWLDQYDCGGFLQLWEISNGLIEKGDIQRLTNLWRAALRNRRDDKKKFRELFYYYELALAKAGLIKELYSAREEFESMFVVKTIHELDTRIMSKTLFWDLIEKAKVQSVTIEERPHLLKDLLMPFSATEIERFQKIFYEQMSTSYTWDLWAAAYLAFGGCGDDSFEYFRAWLISEGRTTYEAVLKNVNSIVELKLVPGLLEGLISVASSCYRDKTGNELDGIYNLADKPAGIEWKETDSDLKKRYPKLWKSFN